jgi:tetratricopeptide (TPR) repeat protein
VTLKPDLVEASFNLGLVLLDQGDRATAQQSFERVADLKPELFANQLQLARTLAAGQELRRAVGHYHCALAIDPRSREALQELAALLRRLGRKAGAATLLASS